jgi:serine/threonine protein kinase
VSDFGASALKPMDKNDFIMLIQGTLGYIDPESFVSHHLTDKSDVYSFGVVLLDIMTRKKAIYIDTSNEQKALSYTFILMFHQNKLRDILDTEIVDDEVMILSLFIYLHHFSLWRSDQGESKTTQFAFNHRVLSEYESQARNSQ